MRKKYFKKAMSLFLAGTMMVSCAGCGKTEKKKKEETLDSYELTQEAQFDVILQNAKIIDGVMYASYLNYSEELESEDNFLAQEEGLITYNFSTKEQNSVKIEMENFYLSSFYVDSNKNIVVAAEKLIYDEETREKMVQGEVEEFTYQQTDVELVYNQNLECVSTKEGETITVNSTDGSLSNESIICSEVDSENRLYQSCAKFNAENEEYYIKVLNQDGTEAANIKTEDMVEKLIRMTDGRIVCLAWGENGTAIYELDVEGNKLGKEILNLEYGYAEGMYAGKDNSILLSENGYLKRVDCEKGETTKILKFLDNDIMVEDVSCIAELENGDLCLVLYDYERNTSEIDRLTKVEASAKTSNKEEIHLGVFGLDSDLQEQVIQFNKSNEKYKIVVDDYLPEDDLDSEKSYEEALKKFHTAITSGNCPDIIDLSATSIVQYVEKGILEDLGPYLEKDSELSEEIFVQSILDAYRVDGKIYTIPRDFTINGLVGATSKVGVEQSWSMAEFVEYAESLPDGVEILADLTSDGLLRDMLYYSMDEYVDWVNGTCSFNTEGFIKLLEFCDNYEKAEKYYENYEYDEEDSSVTKIRNNQIVMETMYLDSMESYMVEKAVFGEDITIKGFPSTEGNGLVIDTYMPLLGISTKSKYKDAAWEFIRTAYTGDEQDTMSLYGFPIRQDKLDEMLEKSKEAEGTAPDGTKYSTVWSFDGLDIYVPVSTDEDIAKVKEIINAADTSCNYEEEIYSMVLEEAEAFFSGQKSAKEVADIIQSRVSIYVKENR